MCLRPRCLLALPATRVEGRAARRGARCIRVLRLGNSITHALDVAVADLGLRRPDVDMAPAEWRTLVKKHARESEAARRLLSFASLSSARRLALALSPRGDAPLSTRWLGACVLGQSARGPSSMLLAVLCEQFRLVPHVRSHFPGNASGAPPPVNYCDICHRRLARRADLDHVIFDCPDPALAAARRAWLNDLAALFSSCSLAYPTDADRLLAFVGLVSPTRVEPPLTTAQLSIDMSMLFIRHFGHWETRSRDWIRRLPPTSYES